MKLFIKIGEVMSMDGVILVVRPSLNPTRENNHIHHEVVVVNLMIRSKALKN